MTTFAIVLNAPSEKAWTAIKDAWPDRYYFLTETVAFVAPEKTTITEFVAETVGMNVEGDVSGFVTDLDNRSGFNKSALWEWMRKFE